MAKYTITMSCGHEDTIELFGKEIDRQRKLGYFKESGLCKECYKKQMYEKAKAEGLIFNASVLPYIDNEDGSLLLSVWFSGDTKPHKDEIKAIGGYRWIDRESAEDWYSLGVPMCWNKVIHIENLETEIQNALSIGAKSVVSDSGLFAAVNYQIAINQQKEWEKQKEKIALIQKPTTPDVLKGHKWNQKIYGKSGNYSIYPDGNKVTITDEQAKEIKEYLAAKKEYKKKVEEITNA